MPAVAAQTPWEIQKSVIFAIFIRELNARFGRFSLGIVWALLEPITYIVIFSFIRGRFTGADLSGIPPILFFASGVLMYNIFRNVISTSVSSVEVNEGLFNYQRVKPIDTFIARAAVELVGILGAAVVLLGGLYLFGFVFTIFSYLQIIGVLLCMLMLTGGIGLVCSVLAPLWQDSKKLVPLVLRKFFYISGVFFPADAIPRNLEGLVMWNPLLHAMELMRDALFTNYTSHACSWNYLIACSASSLAIGLVIYRLFRVTVLTSGYIR